MLWDVNSVWALFTALSTGILYIWNKCVSAEFHRESEQDVDVTYCNISEGRTVPIMDYLGVRKNGIQWWVVLVAGEHECVESQAVGNRCSALQQPKPLSDK